MSVDSSPYEEKRANILRFDLEEIVPGRRWEFLNDHCSLGGYYAAHFFGWLAPLLTVFEVGQVTETVTVNQYTHRYSERRERCDGARTVMFELRQELYTLSHTVNRSRSESTHRASPDIDFLL
jgi:hypothetical protein